MDRRKVWFVIGSVLAVSVLGIAPLATLAAGTCAITVTPDTVHVGETFVVSATGFEPNETAMGFAGLDPNEGTALSIPLDENGSLTMSVVAKSYMIGKRSVSLTGNLSDCGAKATLTVLPATGPPATDTLASAEPMTEQPIALLLVAVWASGLAVGYYVSKGRRSPRARYRGGSVG